MVGYDFSKPFKVRIIEDSRNVHEYGPNGNLSGQLGTCLGRYEYPHTDKKIPSNLDPNSDDIDPLVFNPLIRTDSGDYIWGIECWFDRDTKTHHVILERILEGEKRRIRTILKDKIRDN